MTTLPFTLIPHAEVAQALGVTEKQLDWLRYNKKIRGYKVCREYKYSQEQIADYLAGVEVNKTEAVCAVDTNSSSSDGPPTGTSHGPNIVSLSVAQRGAQAARKHKSSLPISS